MPLDPYLSFFIALLLSLAGVGHVMHMARRERRHRLERTGQG